MHTYAERCRTGNTNVMGPEQTEPKEWYGHVVCRQMRLQNSSPKTSLEVELGFDLHHLISKRTKLHPYSATTNILYLFYSWLYSQYIFSIHKIAFLWSLFKVIVYPYFAFMVVISRYQLSKIFSFFLVLYLLCSWYVTFSLLSQHFYYIVKISWIRTILCY